MKTEITALDVNIIVTEDDVENLQVHIHSNDNNEGGGTARFMSSMSPWTVMSQSQSHPIIIVKHVIIWQPSQLDIYIQLLHNHNNAQDYSLVEGSLKDKKFLLTRTFKKYFHTFYLISFSISKFW